MDLKSPKNITHDPKNRCKMYILPPKAPNRKEQRRFLALVRCDTFCRIPVTRYYAGNKRSPQGIRCAERHRSAQPVQTAVRRFQHAVCRWTCGRTPSDIYYLGFAVLKSQ